VEKYGTARQAKDDNVIWCMHIACWITKAKNTHSEYVILTGVSWQQCLYKCTSVLCYGYIVCLVKLSWCC